MGTAGIILAATPVLRMVLEAFGFLKEEKKKKKAKKVTTVLAGAGVGLIGASFV